MAQPTSVTVKHEGRSIQLTFKACCVFMAGEFAGNVEVDIDCDPSLMPTLMKFLRFQNPGEDTNEGVVATGDPDKGISLCFHSEAVELLEEAPEKLTFLWGDKVIASLAPALAESVPLEQVHTLIDPMQILGTTTMPTSNRIRLGVQRAWLWLLPAVLVAAAGAAFCTAPDGLMLENVPFRQVIGSVLIALGVVIGVVGYRIPYRQIWYNRDQRKLVILEGRALSAEKLFADAKRFDIDGYDHVRLCERQYAPGPGEDSDTERVEWIVSLEGPIPYAFADGRVHARGDALELARFRSGRTARRLAAEVAHHAGLKILEATDW